MGNAKENPTLRGNENDVKDPAERVEREQDFTQRLLAHTLNTMYLPDNFVEKYGEDLAGKSPAKK